MVASVRYVFCCSNFSGVLDQEYGQFFRLVSSLNSTRLDEPTGTSSEIGSSDSGLMPRKIQMHIKCIIILKKENETGNVYYTLYSTALSTFFDGILHYQLGVIQYSIQIKWFWMPPVV